jgi:CubicO group peptidase (beta-lactamase class C family)
MLSELQDRLFAAAAQRSPPVDKRDAMGTLSVTPRIVLFLTAVATAAGQPPPDETPAERRASEMLDLIEGGSREELRDYVQSTYTGEFARMPVEVHVDFLLDMQDRMRAIAARRIEALSATEARAAARSRVTGDWVAFRVRVEPQPPHRIVGIGIAPLTEEERETRPASEAEAVAVLERYLNALGGADLFSGAVLVARGDDVLVRAAWGLASRDFDVPNLVETKFNLGSMNKMFTAVAIAQLVEQGRLRWDSPVGDFLPGFPTPEAASSIRIHHLLTHTSGLGSYFNRAFQESSRARWRTVSQMMELADGEVPEFEPGTRWKYSNTGYLVLGRIIEIITGRDYHDYVREYIARPAGMAATDAYELDQVNPNLAVGYEKVFTAEGVAYRNNIFEHVIRGGPAGGGYSTVEDLHRFARALQTGRLVQPATFALMIRPKPELASPTYGFGFGLNPDGSIGHTGGFPGISSALAIYPDTGLVVVVLANLGRASGPVVRKTAELLH